MVQVDAATLTRLEDVLLNKKGNVPLDLRFRALFMLKGVSEEQADDAVEIIAKGFNDKSALLKHELAYGLGQMRRRSAIPKLTKVLQAQNEDPMVRHEAAEALGAISAEESIDTLEQFINDKEQVVRETCEIAIAKIKWDRDNASKAADSNSRFHSIDPAPPIPTAHSSLISSTSAQHEAAVPHLQKTLNDTSLPLFERYRAMFALRNLAGSPGDPVANQALAALCSGFSEPSSSLLKHEIAFVLGQLGSPDSAEKLIEILNEEGEEGMVRHEAAEALGGIDFTIKGDRAILKDGKEKSLREEIWDILQDYAGKEGVPDVVRESCIVARDMLKYANDPTEFELLDEVRS